ncbi:MAG: CYCXC family (seleno)protein [Janthinobacterium lividum]
MNAWIRYGVLGLVTATSTVKWVAPTADTPAYFTVPPHRNYPALMSGTQLTGPYFSHTYQVVAYEMAAKVESVLFQQPCYCRCDLAMRHKSLHSCFEGTHGAVCATCMRQAVYAYQQTQLGKTPQEIRAGIARGEYKDVNVEAAIL